MDSSLIESFNLTQEENKDNNELGLIENNDAKNEKVLKKEKKLSSNEKKELIKDEVKKTKNEEIENSYTINLASFSSKKRAEAFVLDNNLTDNAVIYDTGSKYTKVRYGTYASYGEAKSDMKRFSQAVLKNKPYISKIKKYQEEKLVKKQTKELKSNLSNVKTKNTKSIENKLVKNDIEQLDSETKKKDLNQLVDEANKLLNDEPLKNKDIEALKNELIEKDFEEPKIKNLLLSAPKDSFTINLATFNSLKRAQDFVFENNLIDHAFVYEFGTDEKYAKVIYGIYKNSKEAQLDIKRFNDEVLKNKPFINRVKKHQDLYKKYNQ